jgi:hypothetical protein
MTRSVLRDALLALASCLTALAAALFMTAAAAHSRTAGRTP